MGIQVGETGEFSGGKRRGVQGINIVPPKRQKPVRPIEPPFPEKPEFRLGIYTLIEEKDDYLLCKGFDPNATWGQYTPAVRKTIKVAKPPLLQRTALDGETVEIGGIDYTYEYSDDELGVRTASWTEYSVAQEEEQRINTPYFVDDLIVAVEIRENAGLDGLDVDSEEGGRLSWVDINASGRHWKPRSTTIIGTLDENLSESGSATMTVTEGGTGTREVHERLGLGDNDPLSSGAYVAASWVDGVGYVAIGTGCPE